MIGKEKQKLERYWLQYHFAQYKYDMDCVGIEPGTLQGEVDICLSCDTMRNSMNDCCHLSINTSLLDWQFFLAQ
jgi:hypothetical protein